jgi:hypothetical protein
MSANIIINVIFLSSLHALGLEELVGFAAGEGEETAGRTKKVH